MTRNALRIGQGINVQIDASELLAQIDDDYLLDEVASRKLSTQNDGQPLDIDLVREAYSDLLCGRVAAAQATLDRLLNPKWKTTKKCAQAFAQAKKLF
jgi:hypothetical protein